MSNTKYKLQVFSYEVNNALEVQPTFPTLSDTPPWTPGRIFFWNPMTACCHYHVDGKTGPLDHPPWTWEESGRNHTGESVKWVGWLLHSGNVLLGQEMSHAQCVVTKTVVMLKQPLVDFATTPASSRTRNQANISESLYEWACWSSGPQWRGKLLIHTWSLKYTCIFCDTSFAFLTHLFSTMVLHCSVKENNNDFGSMFPETLKLACESHERMFANPVAQLKSSTAML